jgi:predicted small integral membrane protein
MGVLARVFPLNEPRVGVLGIATQRGDRLFVSLLGAAFIHLAWLGLAPATWPLWGASIVSLVYAALVFRFV